MNSSVTQQIKDKIDIVEYISRYAPDLKKAGRYYKACCPFHGEKTPSFVVNPDTQSWRCFGACAEGGDLFNFAMKRQGWSFSEAITELGRIAGIDTSPERSDERREKDAKYERLRGLLKTASEYYHQHLLSQEPDALSVMAYVREKRGFNDATIAKFQIGYAPTGWDNMLKALTSLGYNQQEILDTGLLSKNEKGSVYDRFRHRLMIPIRDERGHVIGFGARALDPNDNPKYLNSPQTVVFDKSKTLFGLDLAKASIRESGIAVIVEGYMDAIQAHQAGYTNVVAQMGTAMTEPQLALIAPRYAKKVILALDADSAGQSATRRSLDVARTALENDYNGRMLVEMRILHIDNAKDPDDVLRETPSLWQTYVDSALPVADFVIEMETTDLTAKSTIQDKQTIASRLLPLLTASENTLYKNENIQKLALRLRLDESDLLAWAKQLREQEILNKKKQDATSAKLERITPPTHINEPRGLSVLNDEPPPMPSEFFNNSEEPPPLPDNWGEPPPDDDYFADYPSPVAPELTVKPVKSRPTGGTPSTPALTSRHVSRAAEAFCLRKLLQDFDFYYQINRKFREILVNAPDFKDHPFSELMLEDFSQTDYRLVLTVLLEAHQQDDLDALTYLESHLEPTLLDILQTLVVDEMEEVHLVTRGKLSLEMNDILKQLERHQMTEREKITQVMKRVFDIRLNRLNRELSELKFLLTDATGDHETVKHLLVAVKLTISAREYFEKGVQSLALS